MKKSEMIVYLAIIFSMFFWGFSFIWTKSVFEFYKPITIILFRLVISSGFLFFLNIFLKKLNKITIHNFKWLLLLSFFQPFMYFIGENYGLYQVSPTVAAVIIATIPLFTPIAAWFFLKEKLAFMNYFGIVLSIFGVLMVILKPDLTLVASPNGVILLFMAVLAAVAYSVVLMKIRNKMNVYSLITYQNTIGIFMFAPLFFIIEYNDFAAVGFKIKPMLSIIQLAVFASSLAFVLFTYGVQKLGISKANTFSNSIPVFTAFFSFFLLEERLSFLNIFGIGIVIAGLFLSQVKNQRFARTKLFFIYLKNFGDKNN